LIPGSEDDGDKMQTLARFFAALMILIFIYITQHVHKFPVGCWWECLCLCLLLIRLQIL